MGTPLTHQIKQMGKKWNLWQPWKQTGKAKGQSPNSQHMQVSSEGNCGALPLHPCTLHCHPHIIILLTYPPQPPHLHSLTVFLDQPKYHPLSGQFAPNSFPPSQTFFLINHFNLLRSLNNLLTFTV